LYRGTHLRLRFKIKPILLIYSKLHIILVGGKSFNERIVNYLSILYKFTDLLMCKYQIKLYGKLTVNAIKHFH